MTRTARSSHPRAILKDRSESRSGMDKSLKKGGAGAHSWGELLEDPSLYPADDDGVADDSIVPSNAQGKPESNSVVASKPEGQRTPDSPTIEAGGFSSPEVSRVRGGSLSVSYTDEDIALAKRFRTRVFSGGSIDLSTIARTSPAVANPANLDISSATLKSPKSFSSTHSSTSEEH